MVPVTGGGGKAPTRGRHRMADLEKHAIRRDRAFLVRLIAVLGVVLVAGAVAMAAYGTSGFGSCAADRFQDFAEPEEGASP